MRRRKGPRVKSRVFFFFVFYLIVVSLLMITSQMVGPIAILDRAQKAIIMDLVDGTKPNALELADALKFLYRVEDYIMRAHRIR
jgi:hypothetical protein